MTTTLLIVASVLLALSGLAIMHLAARLKEAETVQANDRHMIKTMQLHINDMLEVNAVNEQLTAHNRELNAQIAETKHKAYQRQQELLNAVNDAEAQAYTNEQIIEQLKAELKDATRAADDNEWLYNDANNDLHEACRELEKLQEVHKATIEGMTTAEAQQAGEIAQLNEIIENLQGDISSLMEAENFMASKIAELMSDIEEDHQTIHNLLTDRTEAIAHMQKQNEKIAELELAAFYAAEADLTEAIAAAEEASTEAEEETPIHIDDKKAWICIGEWARLIVYKHNIYQPYVQHGLGAKIERTKRSDLTTKAQERYNALKAALKSL